ncbi:DEAD/DEAH box helicase [Emticicia aquatilis]|uniref:DEAD/DEAH box helicase n=1 Tax=Emticicia aquatilis TaxID=1537369 RepID=A0A916Z2V1_9BACT|nr:DEAD/DEAH box helicase [Emticicia aquatilis]GGD71934.1 DEAD/DEAH box helicase [Emticicia aquatilis]
MKFDDYSISHELKKNIAELGFKRPTDIQFKSIPPILKGEDVLAIAQTGTGKTAAFAIPIISILQEMKHSVRYEEGVKCIVLEPTRELALQVTEVFQKMAKGTKVETLCLFGGVDQAPQVDKLVKGVDILIATPGRMFDLIYQKHLKITGVEILVLDEADHMLDLGFIKDIQDVKKFLPKFHQTLFFSATINEQIKKVAYSLVRNAIRIQLSPKDPVAKNIKHSVAFVEMDDKRFFLERVINENPESKILVFVRTKVRAERVKSAMQRVGIESETIHGDKEQLDRLSVLDKFRSGEVKILIATDVSARGIDIPNVDYVVNYDLPDVPENYVHRVGRTGRGMQKGLAVSFCATEEKPILDEIEGFMGKKIRVLELDKQEYNETIDFSKDTTNYDLKALLKEAEELDALKKKTKKKKK